MLLTETDQWRKPSETIWPEIVATKDALWPEEMSAKAKMLAALREWLNNCCFQDTKLFTSSNEVANNKVNIENIGICVWNTGLVEGGTPLQSISYCECHVSRSASQENDGAYIVLMMTARPKRLTMRSTTPWCRCALTNESGLSGLSA